MKKKTKKRLVWRSPSASVIVAHKNLALVRRAEDLADELHWLGNELHKSGLHRQGAEADVAVGVIETIVEELKDGG